MAFKVNHTFVSSLPDGPNDNLLQPSHWNADHDAVFVDDDYPDRQFRMIIKIRNAGTAEEYIETLWEENL